MLVNRWFEHLAEYCEKYNNLIPISFILGFYVSIVVARFWEQLNALPWPHRTAVYVSAMIHGRDDKGRMIRRTIVRYLTVAYVLTMRDICPPVRKRFRTFGHLVPGICLSFSLSYVLPIMVNIDE